MGDTMQFDFFYGVEAEMFSFYRIPRMLVKDERFKGLSSDAKLLYGLMLDRMSLSIKNGWLDKENRAYIIYTVDNMAEDLGCSKPTCTKIMCELDSVKGIGLIEKKRRGLGKPDIIYVKNFNIQKQKDLTSGNKEDGSQEVKEFDFQKQKKLISGNKENESQEIKKFDFQKEEDLISGNKENEFPEVKTFASNYNNQNHKEMNYTDPIDQSENGFQKEGCPTEQDLAYSGRIADVPDNISKCIAHIRRNLEYGHYMTCTEIKDKELFEEIYETVCDVVCVKRKTLRINGEDYPYELVKSRFLKLNSSHVEYVMDCLGKNTTKITNIRAYLITALYNAPSTMKYYYQQEVQHDMYGGGWEEKGIGPGTSGHYVQKL